ncbi:MAG: class I tRNA ligase family protein, partial [Spirochaetaceae bacterium]|nr:class I tRNA ligase family protein [Spirochaetaceae bacterium]
PLAKPAIQAVMRDKVKFVPERFSKTYYNWMENIRDWCISRQLWWGHRIPVWYCQECGEMIVSRTDPDKCTKCGCDSSKLVQDPDVLDTWFSSWLWPFSTLGWPEKTPDLEKFYPTTALVTAYDIIFFWVSRMIMAGLEFTGKAPFKDIYIHGLVRDKQGRKMSKSLGNGLDPLEIIEEYGADALKYTLSFMCAQGQDVLIDKDSFKLGSRFANKIWNASRYLLGNLEGRNLIPVTENDLTELDKWIYSRLDNAVRTVRNALDNYRYNDGAQALYEFFWTEFCDWYVEASKLSFWNGDDHEKDRATSVLMNILEESLRLLHPYLPFVTEEIYQKLPLEEIAKARGVAFNKDTMLIDSAYPEIDDSRKNAEIEKRFDVLQDLIRAIRALRAECGISPDVKLHIGLLITPNSEAEVCREKTDMIKLLSGVKEIDFVDAKPQGAIGTVGLGFECFIYVDESINKEQLLARFKKELASETAFVQKVDAKLAGKFAQNAPKEVVEAEKAKREETLR